MLDRKGQVDENHQKRGWGHKKPFKYSLVKYEEARNFYFYLTCREWGGGWRTESEIKSTDCYSRGPRFDAPT